MFCAVLVLPVPDVWNVYISGAVFVYARAYLLWKIDGHLVEARRCADVVWTRGFLKKGPGKYLILQLYELDGRD